MPRVTQNHWILQSPIAHRGIFDNKKTPENSIASINAAIKKNIPIELDVRVSADGIPYIFHDETLSRITGCQGKLSQFDSGELSKLRLIGTSFSIPTLEEVLAVIGGKVPVLLEIKNEGRAGRTERSIASVLEKYTGEIAVQSFNPYSLAWFRREMPKLLRGQLSGNFKDIEIHAVKRYLLRSNLIYRISEPDFINYDLRALPNKRITRMYEHGMPIILWTVRTKEDQRIAEQYGFNYISELDR